MPRHDILSHFIAHSASKHKDTSVFSSPRQGTILIEEVWGTQMGIK